MCHMTSIEKLSNTDWMIKSETLDGVHCERFAFVLILSLKKASAKSKSFGVSGGLKLNLLVKHTIYLL